MVEIRYLCYAFHIHISAMTPSVIPGLIHKTYLAKRDGMKST